MSLLQNQNNCNAGALAAWFVKCERFFGWTETGSGDEESGGGNHDSCDS